MAGYIVTLHDDKSLQMHMSNLILVYDYYNSAESVFFFQCILMRRRLETQNHDLLVLATTYFLVTGPKAMAKKNHCK